jgi:glyoxylase-like metal-dependent hydrolase (beta-lactamase superfamily II)
MGPSRPHDQAAKLTSLPGARSCRADDPVGPLALYSKHRGDRPVTAVVYTHSHIDHFGGVVGVVDADTQMPIVAPQNFLEHAVSENVYAGREERTNVTVPDPIC